MKKENRKNKKKRKEKKNGREKRGFVVVVASLLAVDCGVLQGRQPIGDLLQTSVVGWCGGCGIVWIQM